MAVNVYQEVILFVFVHDSVNKILVAMDNVMDMKYMCILYIIRTMYKICTTFEYSICIYFIRYCICTSSLIWIIFVLDWCMLLVQAHQSIIGG